MSKLTNDSLTWSGTGCTHTATVGVKKPLKNRATPKFSEDNSTLCLTKCT